MSDRKPLSKEQIKIMLSSTGVNLSKDSLTRLADKQETYNQYLSQIDSANLTLEQPSVIFTFNSKEY